jgi:hypothetical protein
MQEKHTQLGDFGGIPGAPSGPPANEKCAPENSEQKRAFSDKPILGFPTKSGRSRANGIG